jgi:hypothetical protein
MVREAFIQRGTLGFINRFLFIKRNFGSYALAGDRSNLEVTAMLSSMSALPILEICKNKTQSLTLEITFNITSSLLGFSSQNVRLLVHFLKL